MDVIVTVHPKLIRSIVHREVNASTVMGGMRTGKSRVQCMDRPVDAVLKVTTMNWHVCQKQPVERAAHCQRAGHRRRTASPW